VLHDSLVVVFRRSPWIGNIKVGGMSRFAEVGDLRLCHGASTSCAQNAT